MTTAAEYGNKVLAGIIPDRVDLLENALSQLSEKHFVDKLQATFFTLLQRYLDYTQGVLSESALESMLKNRDKGTISRYLEAYKGYANLNVSDSDFLWAVHELREAWAERSTDEALTFSREVLKSGKSDPKTGEEKRGHKAARETLLENLAAIEQELVLQESPEGDMLEERVDILKEYARKKRDRLEGNSTGILFGIDSLDSKVGGLQPGELILSAGYSSDGKSSLCVQLAWNAAINQGKNVVFLTTETIRPTIIRKLVARHSKLSRFELMDGLNTRDLKAGTLSSDEEEKFEEVVADLEKNPNYGKLYIVQVPRSATMSTIEATLYRLQKQFHIDLVIHDYLALMRADTKRMTERENLSLVLKEAKQLATTFDNGRGVPFVSPWQVNRNARDNAESVGAYSLQALAETAESTNSADVIISLLAPTDNSNRICDLTMQVLKNRDGETANNLVVTVDYATSSFHSKQLGMALTSASSGGLDDLI